MNKSGQDTIKISACMIVKNEEEHLKRCLSSIVGLVDEIIFVDTGSTDNSIEIAKSFGAKIYEHPWQNDFSLHRNQSLSYATGDWCFIIDADEELVIPESTSVEKIKEWLSKMPEDSDAAAIQLQDIQQEKVVMKMNTARFFRKDRVSYSGAVHNQPKIENKGFFCGLCYLHHYGYDLSPEKMQAKEERTKSLLLAQLEKDPTNYLTYFYLCQISATRGFREDCVKYGEEYISHKDDLAEQFNRSIYYTVLMNYMKMNNEEKTKRWLLEGLHELPEDLDLNFALVQYGIWTKDKDKIIVGARRYMRIYEELQRNITKNECRFTYTYSMDQLSHVASTLAITTLSEGFETMKILEQTLPHTDEKLRDEICKRLQKAMEPFGLKIKVEFKQDGNKKQVSIPDEELLNKIIQEDNVNGCKESGSEAC